MIVELPNELTFDIDAIPDNLEKQVADNFTEYTKGTREEFTYQDKLAYMDLIISCLHKTRDSYEEVKQIILDRVEGDIEEYQSIPSSSDFYSIGFMEECFDKGMEACSHYSHFKVNNHRIYDKLMDIEFRAIKAVVNWEPKED